MAQNDDLPRRLTEALDRADAISLLQQAIRRESITGNEANFVALLEGEMRRLGINPVERTDFLPGRPNIRGERQGKGGGNRLLFIGHTDTVRANGWREHWAGTEREDPFSGAVIDGSVWGRGAGDLKAGICSSLAAFSLLDRAGIELKGDVVFAFVGDEESGEPGVGVSAGIKAYVADIEAGSVMKPDFTIYVEPTQLAVYTAQIGFFIADITITGKSAYFGVPELGKDALKASHAVMTALWRHSDEVAARTEHDLIGKGFLLITEISGGGLIAVPGECKLSLIRKLLPGESLDDAAKRIEDIVRGAVTDSGIRVDIVYPAGRDHSLGGSASEIDRSLPAVDLLARSVADAMSGRGGLKGAPFWSESSFFINRLGVPAVYCAPGDISNCHTVQEHVEVEEYLAGVVAFAIFMARYCGIAN